MLLTLLRTFLKPHWKLLIGVVAFQLAQSIATLFLPGINANIIDDGVLKGDTGYILEFGGIMLLISLGQVVASIIAVYFGSKAAMRVGRDLRGAIFHRVAVFSEREVSKFGAPSLITRTTNDVHQVQILVLMTCTLLVAAPILAIGGIIAALQQDVGLSWVLAIAVPLMLIAIGSIIIRVVPQFRALQKRIDTVNRVLREQLTGIRVVRAFVRERVEADRFDLANQDVTSSALRAGRLFALVFPLVTLIMFGTSVAVQWLGAFRINDGTLQVGTLSAFLAYIIQILAAVMMATFMAIMIPRAAVAADRISEVLGTDSSVVLPLAPVTKLRSSGTVEFRNVSFEYPGADKPVLRNLDFAVVPGTTTAIIGSTGAGKTTLISLMPRLFDVTDGEVLIDGVDVRDLDEDLLWSRIGLVPQRAYLFTGTIASNLRYGNPEATDDELWRALDIAQAKDFVTELPDALDAEVSQGGTNFSGGQRQRLAIARALVKRAEILVFDDSFSALDTRTDARLRASLTKNERATTRIVVAQRVSTIIGADEILVLDHGEIVDRGTHEQLLRSSDTYAEIVNSQLKAEEVA
jgi:ATP-binding cassette subfamily B multidrug efflux pump